jgi:hemolysin-activating ACP:hemolysin acyltransferase
MATMSILVARTDGQHIPWTVWCGHPRRREAQAHTPSKSPALDPAKLAELEGASIKLLGQVTWLLSLSPQHRYMFLADFEWRIRPAIVLRQCRLFHSKGRVVAFVSWAYVSDEVAGRLQLMPGRLAPQEWRGGNKFMLVDVVAPFGGAEQLVQAVIKQHGKGPAPADTSVASMPAAPNAAKS